MKRYNKSNVEYYNYITSEIAAAIKKLPGEQYCYDEWGLIECFGVDTGVDYNLCIDNTTGEMINESAFYPMYRNPNSGYWEDDTSTWVHYEINFDDPNWKSDVEQFARNYLKEVMRAQ